MIIAIEAFFFLLFSTADPLPGEVLVQEGALLLKRVFPLKGVLLPWKVRPMKVLIIVAAMKGLLLLKVSHHEVAQMFPQAHLLEIQTVM